MSALPHTAPDPPRGVGRLVLRAMSMRLNCAIERSLPFRLIVWRLVPRAMGLLGGRLPLVPFSAAVLETQDPRSGSPHRRAVVYFNDGEDVILVASKGKMASDPHWLGNAISEPSVIFGGRRFRAELVEDEKARQLLWKLADAYFPPNREHRAHAARYGREIPILRLRRR